MKARTLDIRLPRHVITLSFIPAWWTWPRCSRYVMHNGRELIGYGVRASVGPFAVVVRPSARKGEGS